MTVYTNFFGGAFFGGGFFGAGTETGGGTPPGVPGRKHKGSRPKVIRLSDVKNREDTAEYLKNQLRLRHPESAFTEPVVDRQAQEKERKRLAKQARREAEMRRKAEDAAARFAKESALTEAQINERIQIENDNMRILLMLASAV